MNLITRLFDWLFGSDYGNDADSQRINDSIRAAGKEPNPAPGLSARERWNQRTAPANNDTTPATDPYVSVYASGVSNYGSEPGESYSSGCGGDSSSSGADSGSSSDSGSSCSSGSD